MREVDLWGGWWRIGSSLLRKFGSCGISIAGGELSDGNLGGSSAREKND